MARSTTTPRTPRSPQASKRGRRLQMLDANVRRHWRKLYCRDRNVRQRGADKNHREKPRTRRRQTMDLIWE